MKKMHDEDFYHLPWITYVNNLLNNCGMSFLWNNYQDYDIRWLQLSLERKLLDISLQNWNSSVNNNILCSNYRMFKTNFTLEKYFSLLSYSDYITFVKFRCGNHSLPISNIRYNRLSNDIDRMCKKCNLNDQGDEFHYILVCPYFSAKRKIYIKNYYYTRPNGIKFSQLFNSKNISELKNLIKFIKYVNSEFP